MKAVVQGAKACMQVAKGNTTLAGAPSDSHSFTIRSRSRRSTLNSATALYRARDSAFRHVKHLRSMLNVPHRGSVSSQYSHDS